MKKVEREGKVFVDWSQNHQRKTTIAVYSLRARERPTASTPLTWEEVEQAAEKATRICWSSRPRCAERIEATATSSPRSSSSSRSSRSSETIPVGVVAEPTSSAHPA